MVLIVVSENLKYHWQNDSATLQAMTVRMGLFKRSIGIAAMLPRKHSARSHDPGETPSAQLVITVSSYAESQKKTG